MSGNYDFPPASNRSSRESPAERPRENIHVTARLQHLRNLLSSQRERADTAAALETLDLEMEDYRSNSPRDFGDYQHNRSLLEQQLQTVLSPRRVDRLRRRGILEPERDRSSQNPRSSAGMMEQEPNPPFIRQRRRSARPSETWATSREPRPRSSLIDVDGLPGLQQAAATIRDADAAINSALGEAIPRMESPDIPEIEWGSSLQPDPIWEPQTDRWRAKRRKLDSDDNREGTRGFSYGRYGQVVPGALRMEIASCDGGAYCEPSGESSLPENVLHNDSSVYCTKSDRCNLILKHRGETPFCLRKIVIKAPKSGFDAPIQEGLIFVSMTSEELLERTSQYRISYTPPGSFRRRYRQAVDPPSGPPEQYMTVVQRLRQERGPSSEYEGSEIHDEGSNSLAPRAGRISNYYAPIPDNSNSGYRVTTEYDNNSDEEAEASQENDNFPFSQWNDRVGTGNLPDDELICPEDDNSLSEDDNDVGLLGRGRRAIRRNLESLRRQEDILRRRRGVPSIIEPVGPARRGESARQGVSTPQTPSDVMTPHARFFIEKEKSMVSIKFDPAPSGRFILIKLWSPRTGGNIDIQSIMVHGYAGPRYFPSGEFR